MAFIDDIGALIIETVDFQDDQLEQKAEHLIQKTAELTEAGLKFQTVAGDNQATTDAGTGLIRLAAKLGTAFPALNQDQANEFKEVIASVYDNPDPETDAAASAVFNAAVDTVVAAKDLATYADTLRAEE